MKTYPTPEQWDELKLAGPAFIRAVSRDDLAGINAILRDRNRDDVILLALALAQWMTQQIEWVADFNECTPDEVYDSWQQQNVEHVYGRSE